MKLLTVTILLSLTLLSACSAPHSDMKSPCVGAEGSPCDRRPVNEQWLKMHQQG